MSTNTLSEQVEGLPTEIATVLNRLSETYKIIAKGYEIRTPEQYKKFATTIQSFNDGVGEFSQENLTNDPHFHHRTEMKKFLKRIGQKKYIPIMESTEFPPTDAELPFAQFFFTRDLQILEPLFRKFCSPYRKWNNDWGALLKSNDEQRPNAPYWGWHSGEAEAPDQYQDLILSSKRATYFAARTEQFMDPVEVMQFMLYLAVMKKKLMDTKNWTICPRSRWSDDYVPRFDSNCDMYNIYRFPPGDADGGLRVRILSVLSAVS